MIHATEYAIIGAETPAQPREGMQGDTTPLEIPSADYSEPLPSRVQPSAPWLRPERNSLATGELAIFRAALKEAATLLKEAAGVVCDLKWRMIKRDDDNSTSCDICLEGAEPGETIAHSEKCPIGKADAFLALPAMRELEGK